MSTSTALLTDRVNVRVESEQDANSGSAVVADARPTDIDQMLDVEQRVHVDKTAKSDGQFQLPGLFAVTVEHDAVATDAAPSRQLYLVSTHRNQARVGL